MSDTTKIPFSFCRIKRAAELMGIYTEDLLSLAVANKITLCLKLDGLKSFLLVDGNADEIKDWYLSLSNNYSSLAFANSISKYSSFSIERMSYDEESDDTIFHPWFYQSQNADGSISSETSQSHQGRAFGLWVPQLPAINSVLNYGRASISWGSLGFYRTDESAPSICLIPLPLNYDDICDNEEDDENYEERYPNIEITENDLWITSDQVRELLKYNGDYNDMPSSIQCGISTNSDLIQDIKKVNHIAEHHATNREKLFKSAIFLLSKYPNECRGERKEISPEKWKDCIISHKDEIPPLTITNEEVILKHLRSAVNVKV